MDSWNCKVRIKQIKEAEWNIISYLVGLSSGNPHIFVNKVIFKSPSLSILRLGVDLVCNIGLLLDHRLKGGIAEIM